MSSTPREIGTLIVVVLRANHLPNKRHIGKQDPYCVVVLNGEKRRTKALKRGGQHPEWDEEIRFTLFEDVDDVLNRTAKGDDAPPAPPPKEEKKVRKVKGGKTMKVACFADDPREPDFIGEVDVDLTEVLTKGETDEWFTLMNKDKFAGKVYLELTFWSNEPAPEKKTVRKAPKPNKQYAGPGSFVPLDGSPNTQPPKAHSRHASDVVPSSLRAANPYGNVDLYVPPYARNSASQVDNLARDFGEFGVSNHDRRRESFPPAPNPYIGPVAHTQSTLNSYTSYGYEHQQEPNPYYSYETPSDPHASMHYQHGSNGTIHGYQSQPYGQASYDAASLTFQQPPRAPHHSLSTGSSGFMPLNQASVFSQHPTSEPSGFLPVSHTPAPVNYGVPYQQPQSYPPPVPTPAPTVSYLPQSTSLPFQPQQSLPPAQPYGYPGYGIASSASAPLQQYISSPPPPTPGPPQTTPAPLQPGYGVTSPVQQDSSAIQYSQHPNGQTSRPLPQQPQIVYQQQQPAVQATSPPPPLQVNGYSPTQGPSTFLPPPPPPPQETNYAAIPPPPPPPSLSVSYSNPNPGSTAAGMNGNTLPVPPPPPPLNNNNTPNGVVPGRRRASLPPTPVIPYQPSTFQHPPPPPPPPTTMHGSYIASGGSSPIPPPPPPPHVSMNGHAVYSERSLPQPPAPVNEHGQWVQSPVAHSGSVY